MGNLSVPMSDAERAQLKAVSKAEGRSMAAWVRKAVGDAYASLSKTTPKLTVQQQTCAHDWDDEIMKCVRCGKVADDAQ